MFEAFEMALEIVLAAGVIITAWIFYEILMAS